MARNRFVALALVMAAVLLTGCPMGVSTTTTTPTKPVARPTPREIVDKTIEAYQQAKAYSDHGEVRLSYKQDGEELSDEAPLSVAFVAPNKLHVAAYQAELASDGKTLKAIIRDEATRNLDGQVVTRPAPKKLTLDDLYADTVLRDTLQSGLGRHPVQLELLFGDAPLLELVKPDATLELLDNDALENHRCFRIGANLADGRYIFWIDAEQYLLRRIEYPAESILPDLAGAPGVTHLKIVADFRLAKFEQDSSEKYAIDAPSSATTHVRYFVLPPQGLPSPLFGKQAGEFKFTTTDDATLTNEDLDGKISLLAWFTNDPACASGLKQISEVVAASAAKDKVNAYVIAAEDRSVPTEPLAEALRQWEVNLPLLRDFEFAGRDLFGVKNAPTLVILDTEGRVQIFEDGINSKLVDTLPVVLERLAAGDDLAAEILGDAKKAQEQYAQDIAVASGEQTQTAVVELPVAEPAAKREPEHFTRTQLWALDTKAIAEPGNFLVIHDQDKPRVLVVDGWRTVKELSASGEVLATHKLDLPENTGISYLRTAVAKDGKRWFVGSALLGKQLFVFDENWQTTLRYPPDDQPHEGLHAVEIADLADDGTPELYVGFWSLIGVQGVTLEGKREWTNRVIPTVLSIVTTPPNEIGWKKILASGDRGALYRINQYGHQDPKLEVTNRQVHRLAAANWEPVLTTQYCGISHLPEGRLLAIGLNADLQEVWNYKLPPGQHNNQIEYLAPTRLRADDQGEWLIAGPDGTVHVVSDDGEFSDTFALGELLTGVTSAKFGADRVVITSTKSGVTAWKLEKK